MDKHAADILRKAKALIDRPEKWSSCGLGDGKTTWCIIAAINYVQTGSSSTVSKYEPPYSAIRGIVKDIPNFNNAPGRTHADVMAAFDAAIARADPQRPSDADYYDRFIAGLETVKEPACA